MNEKFGAITFQCFTIEQVKKINKEIKKNIVGKEPSSAPAGNVSKIGDFFHIPCLPLMELLHPWLYECQQINTDVFGYDIYWHFHLDSMNYNVYEETGKYDWHIDATPNVSSDMKLTCLLNLSEETYEGGNFYLINRSDEIKFESGMGLVFPSLLAHKVTPITKGERITLSYWGAGPAWK
jgi:PKHD-type hydroxylase